MKHLLSFLLCLLVGHEPDEGEVLPPITGYSVKRVCKYCHRRIRDGND